MSVTIAARNDALRDRLRFPPVAIPRALLRDLMRLLPLVEGIEDHALLGIEEDGAFPFYASGIHASDMRAAMAGLLPEEAAPFEAIVAHAEENGVSLLLAEGEAYFREDADTVALWEVIGEVSVNVANLTAVAGFEDLGLAFSTADGGVFKARELLALCEDRWSRFALRVADVARYALRVGGPEAEVTAH